MYVPPRSFRVVTIDPHPPIFDASEPAIDKASLYATRPDLVIVGHSVQEVAYGSSDVADSVRRIALSLRELWAALANLARASRRAQYESPV